VTQFVHGRLSAPPVSESTTSNGDVPRRKSFSACLQGASVIALGRISAIAWQVTGIQPGSHPTGEIRAIARRSDLSATTTTHTKGGSNA
jgi:hypothetical protein